jgi:hypothetical protein
MASVTAGAHDASHARILGDAPGDRHPALRHAAARLERLGRQPRPEHRPVRRRVPRGDPETERVVAQRRRRVGEVAADLAERGGARQRPRELKEAAAIHRAVQRLLERT